jgi:hypothetical protein
MTRFIPPIILTTFKEVDTEEDIEDTDLWEMFGFPDADQSDT